MKKQNSAIEQLRKLINDGFKEYDGDIREEALEVLDIVEKNLKDHIIYNEALLADNAIIKKHCDDQADYVLLMSEKNKSLADFNETYMKGEIDFGTAKLFYAIEPGGVCIINELMQGLKDAAQIVPLTDLVKAVKRTI